MLHSSSIKQQVCFCPKQTEASSLSTKRNMNRWFNRHSTAGTALNLTPTPPGAEGPPLLCAAWQFAPGTPTGIRGLPGCSLPAPTIVPHASSPRMPPRCVSCFQPQVSSYTPQGDSLRVSVLQPMVITGGQADRFSSIIELDFLPTMF